MIIDGHDLTHEMTKGFINSLERIIDAKRGIDSYYILAYSKANPVFLGQIDTKFILTKQKPPALVGSMCFKVDNRAGRLDLEWLLPHLTDTPLPIDNEMVKQWVKGSETKFWQERL